MSAQKQTRLTAAEKAEIRRRYERTSGTCSNAVALAERFSVHKQTILRVVGKETAGGYVPTGRPRIGRPKEKGVKARRKCLRCLRAFISTHIGNRLCRQCNSHADAHSSGMD